MRDSNHAAKIPQFTLLLLLRAVQQQETVWGFTAESLVSPQDRQDSCNYMRWFGSYRLLSTKSSLLPIWCAWSAAMLYKHEMHAPTDVHIAAYLTERQIQSKGLTQSFCSACVLSTVVHIVHWLNNWRLYKHEMLFWLLEIFFFLQYCEWPPGNLKIHLNTILKMLPNHCPWHTTLGEPEGHHGFTFLFGSDYKCVSPLSQMI